MEQGIEMSIQGTQSRERIIKERRNHPYFVQCNISQTFRIISCLNHFSTAEKAQNRECDKLKEYSHMNLIKKISGVSPEVRLRSLTSLL